MVNDTKVLEFPGSYTYNKIVHYCVAGGVAYIFHRGIIEAGFGEMDGNDEVFVVNGQAQAFRAGRVPLNWESMGLLPYIRTVSTDTNARKFLFRIREDLRTSPTRNASTVVESEPVAAPEPTCLQQRCGSTGTAQRASRQSSEPFRLHRVGLDSGTGRIDSGQQQRNWWSPAATLANTDSGREEPVVARATSRQVAETASCTDEHSFGVRGRRGRVHQTTRRTLSSKNHVFSTPDICATLPQAAVSVGQCRATTVATATPAPRVLIRNRRLSAIRAWWRCSRRRIVGAASNSDRHTRWLCEFARV
jgi:hypothetical protein